MHALLVASLLVAGHAPAADPIETAIVEREIAEALSEAAETMLAHAEVGVARARAAKALWTTAFDALQQARASRNAGDFDASISWSQRAILLSGLSIDQLAYPPEKQ